MRLIEPDEHKEFLATLQRIGLARDDFGLQETDTTDPKGDENFGLRGYVTITKLSTQVTKEYTIGDESDCCVGIARDDHKRRKQSCIGANCCPCPHVTSVVWRVHGNVKICLFGVNKIPDFIKLHALARQRPQNTILIGCTGAPGIDHKLSDRVLAGPGEPGHGAD